MPRTRVAMGAPSSTIPISRQEDMKPSWATRWLLSKWIKIALTHHAHPLHRANPYPSRLFEDEKIPSRHLPQRPLSCLAEALMVHHHPSKMLCTGSPVPTPSEEATISLNTLAETERKTYLLHVLCTCH